MPLKVFRRHSDKCKHTSWAKRQCQCVFWIQGTTLDGRNIPRHSLKTRSPNEADRRRKAIEDAGSANTKKLADAVKAYLEDVERRNLTRNVQGKWERLLNRLADYGKANSLQLMSSWGLEHASAFAATLSNLSASTQQKDIERLRTFWQHGIDAQWATVNPFSKVKPPKQKQRPTLPFSAADLERIYAAADPTETAMVWLLRTTGLRIGDACRLAKSSISEGRLILRTAKTDVRVELLLPGKTLEALESFPHASETHYFWSGAATKDSIRNIWSDRMSDLIKKAGVRAAGQMQGHRFRDTFAVEALSKGAPLELVSRLLGHGSIKTTERYYAPWVKERQAQLDQVMRQVWADL